MDKTQFHRDFVRSFYDLFSTIGHPTRWLLMAALAALLAPVRIAAAQDMPPAPDSSPAPDSPSPEAQPPDTPQPPAAGQPATRPPDKSSTPAASPPAGANAHPDTPSAQAPETPDLPVEEEVIVIIGSYSKLRARVDSPVAVDVLDAPSPTQS